MHLYQTDVKGIFKIKKTLTFMACAARAYIVASPLGSDPFPKIGIAWWVPMMKDVTRWLKRMPCAFVSLLCTL